VALLAHPASVCADLRHSLDALDDCPDLTIVAALGPQHGLRGDKQDNMMESPDYRDPRRDIPVFSLYGKVRRPTTGMLDTFDVLLVDLQDLGCRIYTFLTTLRYVLEAAAAHGAAFCGWNGASSLVGSRRDGGLEPSPHARDGVVHVVGRDAVAQPVVVAEVVGDALEHRLVCELVAEHPRELVFEAYRQHALRVAFRLRGDRTTELDHAIEREHGAVLGVGGEQAPVAERSVRERLANLGRDLSRQLAASLEQRRREPVDRRLAPRRVLENRRHPAAHAALDILAARPELHEQRVAGAIVGGWCE
jgi:hypothetical protein